MIRIFNRNNLEDNKDVEVSYVEVGIYSDNKGEPLVVADGKVVGTIKSIRYLVNDKRFDN